MRLQATRVLVIKLKERLEEAARALAREEETLTRIKGDFSNLLSSTHLAATDLAVEGALLQRICAGTVAGNTLWLPRQEESTNKRPRIGAFSVAPLPQSILAPAAAAAAASAAAPSLPISEPGKSKPAHSTIRIGDVSKMPDIDLRKLQRSLDQFEEACELLEVAKNQWNKILALKLQTHEDVKTRNIVETKHLAMRDGLRVRTAFRDLTFDEQKQQLFFHVFTAREREVKRAELAEMKQDADETPQLFAHRLQKTAEVASADSGENLDVLVRRTFLKGILPDVRASLLTLHKATDPFDDVVDKAQEVFDNLIYMQSDRDPSKRKERSLNAAQFYARGHEHGHRAADQISGQRKRSN